MLSGSQEERKAVKNALRYSSRKEDLSYKYKQRNEDVNFTYHGETKPNADVEISVEIENTTGEERNLSLSAAIHAAYYTGIAGEELSKESVQLKLKPNESKSLDTVFLILIKYLNYLGLN